MIEITAISLKTGKNHFNSTYILHILTKLLTKTNFYEKYGQTNEMYKENSRESRTADRKPTTYDRASNFGSKNEM